MVCIPVFLASFFRSLMGMLCFSVAKVGPSFLTPGLCFLMAGMGSAPYLHIEHCAIMQVTVAEVRAMVREPYYARGE